MQVMDAYGAAAQHLGLVAQLPHKIIVRPAVDIDGEHVDQLTNGGNFGPAIAKCARSDAESRLMCSTVIRVPSSLK